MILLKKQNKWTKEKEREREWETEKQSPNYTEQTDGTRGEAGGGMGEIGDVD